MKRILLIILMSILLLGLMGGCGTSGKNDMPVQSLDAAAGNAASVREDPLWTDPDSMKAMVVSDLHYTEVKGLDHSLVPGIALAGEITDVLLEEVIGRHPDVLIMTGDNTNTGDPADVSGLTAKLQRVKDAGIGIILTTGNHDFDLMDPEEFARAYFPLLEPVDRDPASLSYTSIVKDIVFLAMDDNAVYPGGQGEFSAATMQWLEDMLKKYSGRRILFLSHHNVLYGYGEEDTSSHLIQNPELPTLLREGGVRLCLTGHMHFQYILEEDGLWEILSGMPFSGGHLIGDLAVGPDRAVYHAEPIDFASYENAAGTAVGNGDGNGGAAETAVGSAHGNAVEKELQALDLETSAYMHEVFSELLDREGLHGAKKEKVLDLIERYFLYYAEGSLMEHAQELQEDPSYKRMLDALWDYNYGPWMKEMIETATHSAIDLKLFFE